MRITACCFFVVMILFVSGCSKNLEDRLIGSWQMKQAWRQQLVGRDYFQTGYENGIFTFSENGDASFTGNGDTLTGYWRADRYNQTYYNNGTGDPESRSMKFLRISVVNFQQNRRIELEFDDFRFRDNWQEIRAEQYSLGNDRIYELIRK